jgi:hypothetical protein
VKYLFLSVFLCSCASQSGQFIDRGLFNNSPFVTGRGASADEAKARALAAVPADFEIDKAFVSPVLSCGRPGEAPKPDPLGLTTTCDSGTYRVDVALLPKSGEEREAILKTRADGEAALEKLDRAPAAE